MRSSGIVLLPILLLWAGPSPAAAAAADAPPRVKPNVVFILADDLGHGDLGCYGCPDIRTPHIDALAAGGVRFTQFYSSGPECTPTRAAFLTGRYPQRVGGLECAIGLGNVGRYDDAARLRASRDLGLPPDDATLPKLLSAAGYATGLAGKWHLGYEPKFLPKRHGFDTFFGPLGGSVDYHTHHEEGSGLMVYRDDQPAAVKGYMTDLITDEAVRFIGGHRQQPFFLYVAYTAPHDPIQGPDHEKPDPTRKTYAAMVERMDRGVGEIVKALDAAGVARDTLVVFTSDNGGTGKLGRNAPFSRAKGTTFEGGIRVPCVARWPGVLGPGGTADVPAVTMDWTASIARLAGAAPPADRPFDGVDVLKVVQGQEPAPDRPLFWRLRRGEATRRAVRAGPLKYILVPDGKGERQPLFDVERDPGEKTDLLQDRPADARRLRGLLADWEAQVRPAR